MMRDEYGKHYTGFLLSDEGVKDYMERLRRAIPTLSGAKRQAYEQELLSVTQQFLKRKFQRRDTKSN